MSHLLNERLTDLADHVSHAGEGMAEDLTGLGDILRETKKAHKASLSDLTVLSPQNDPFRLDTPANHAKARWLRDQMERCRLLSAGKKIHNRGLHYAIVSLGDATLPDGSRYVNDADCWAFLEDASNTARWLGYVPWEAIIDARNAEPIIRVATDVNPGYWISLDADLHLPSAASLKPKIQSVGFYARQHFRLAFYGEKTSLGPVLEPLSKLYGADLYLPSGEISNTLLATMAKTGHTDGREMIVFIFADCDPAGYQMATSIGHKLRAFQAGLYPNLRFQVFAPALTVEQVKTLGLPSTPLKETERRASGWRERYGVDQTEIDALATLQPDTLRDIVKGAVEPYYDRTLDIRAYRAKKEWGASAQLAFEQQVDGALLEDIHARATTHLSELQATLKALEIQTDHLDLDLPPIEPPQPRIPSTLPTPLVSSEMELIEHIRILKGRKDYSGGAQ